MLLGRLRRHLLVDEDVDLVTVRTGAEPDQTIDRETGRRFDLRHAENATVETAGPLMTVRWHRDAGMLQSQNRGHRLFPLVAAGGRTTIENVDNWRTWGPDCPARSGRIVVATSTLGGR